MVDGLVVEEVSGDDLLDDLFFNLLAQLLGGDVGRVLGRDDDSVNAKRDDCAAVVLVLDCDLGLCIGSQPRECAGLASGLHGCIELVGELNGQGKQFGSLVGCVAEHDTLVTCAEFLESLVVVQTLCNVWGLFLDGDHDVAGLVVEALFGAVPANVLDGAANDLLVVEL